MIVVDDVVSTTMSTARYLQMPLLPEAREVPDLSGSKLYLLSSGSVWNLDYCAFAALLLRQCSCVCVCVVTGGRGGPSRVVDFDPDLEAGRGSNWGELQLWICSVDVYTNTSTMCF